MKHPPWITIASIVYCGWMSRSLAATWWTSPLDHFSWIPLLIWLWPAKNWTENLSPEQARGVAAALAITLLGVAGSVNSVKMSGLAIAIASLVPWSWQTVVWASLAISWTPALGWLMVHAVPTAGALPLLLVRVALALLGVGIMGRKYHDYVK